MCKWNTRAWTYQERLFSPRKLVFLEDGVHYNCQCMTWVEDLVCEGPELKDYFQMFDFDRFGNHDIRKANLFLKKDTFSFRFLPWPDLRNYCDCVHEFSVRNLTHPDDVLRAFSGIQRAFNDAFLKGFHFGIPESFFTVCLLWQPRGRVHRRISKTNFPSWCWTGWEGPISVEAWYAGCDYIIEPVLELYLAPVIPRITKIVEFRKVISQLDDIDYQSVPIADDSMPYRDKPPLSWPSEWLLRDDKTCTHKSLLDVPFRYPVPLGLPTVPAIGFQGVFTNPNLTFEALSAEFWLEQEREYQHDPSNTSTIDISIASVLNSDRQWCGVVQLHEPWCKFEESPYEFVAISRGEMARDRLAQRADGVQRYGEFLRREREHILDTTRVGYRYQYYNALLIRRLDGVAYRTGLGRIRENAFSKLATLKKITLG